MTASLNTRRGNGLVSQNEVLLGVEGMVVPQEMEKIFTVIFPGQ